MSSKRRHLRRIFRSFLPLALLVSLIVVALVGWVVFKVSHPPRRPYLITPEKFSQLFIERGLKATEETWTNFDGSKARGWLLRGQEGAPAVILLHGYGSDRSALLNLGVKLNEQTNYTILWPDLRGHGENPPVSSTTFGVSEADDIQAATTYLRSIKTSQGRALVGDRIGLFGVGLGGYAAIQAAKSNPLIKSLALDSIPETADDLLGAAVDDVVGFGSRPIRRLARLGTWAYTFGNYDNATSCGAAQQMGDRHVILLSGIEAGYLRESTTKIATCFPRGVVDDMQVDLPLTAINLPSASGEQGEAYDRRVIDFFDRTLRATP